MPPLTPAHVKPQIVARWQRLCAVTAARMRQRKRSCAQLSRQSGVAQGTVEKCRRPALAGPNMQALPWLRIQYALAQGDTADTGLLVGGITLSKAMQALLVHMQSYVRIGCDMRSALSRADCLRLVGVTKQMGTLFFSGRNASMPVLIGQQFVFAALPGPDVSELSMKQARVEAGLSVEEVARAFGRSSRWLYEREKEEDTTSAPQRAAVLQAIDRLSRERQLGPQYLPPLPLELVDPLMQSLRLFVGVDMAEHLHQAAFYQAHATRERS